MDLNSPESLTNVVGDKMSEANTALKMILNRHHSDETYTTDDAVRDLNNVIKAPAIELLRLVLDEATGDVENLDKRVWALHSSTYRAIYKFLEDDTIDEKSYRKRLEDA